MSRIPDAPDLETYNRLQVERYECFGFGAEVGIRVACPFCCHPNFREWKVLSVEKDMTEEAVCSNCGRGAKAILDKTPGCTSFEFVQTCGDDPPPYMPPMRRVP